ncbi:MAG TPA: TetR/AcrR family transcriptional regulator C-terminal domain-containing protein, partial [Mycobacterium sp.]|nr:TetR/AcrR family transcriptional regulator C-terminal domain-containing protein [Mycobacterium sp.]
DSCVQEIAEEAGVAKPTVYNHLNDKENLFRHTMLAASEKAMAESLATIELLREPAGDLRGLLRDVGYRLLRSYCDDRSWALRRLFFAEGARFPDLDCGVERLYEALADRVARLSLDGRLRVCDPAIVAEQFFALLISPAEARSRFGTRKLPDAELHTLADAAVLTFLHAFGTNPPTPA